MYLKVGNKKLMNPSYTVVSRADGTEDFAKERYKYGITMTLWDKNGKVALDRFDHQACMFSNADGTIIVMPRLGHTKWFFLL